MRRPPEPRGEQTRLVEQSPWIVSEPDADPLTDTPVGVIHPAKRGGRVLDTPPAAGRLTISRRTIRVEKLARMVGTLRIRFTDIIGVGRSHRTINGTRVETVGVRHLDPPATVYTTEFSVWDDREHTLFTQFLRRYYRKQRRTIAAVDLSAAQLELLVTLYSAVGDIDIESILQKSTADITELFGPLREAGLISGGGIGSMLTGRGYMLVGERIDDDTL
ncbi:hypothetical protein DM826_09455 [Halonotius aquaticus]|jgi:helix-turn-helix protein|uniref:Uncharacterized protein n=1 Tax=Halonotius aquaticus TaxID=2216978 RepID=A0A3A6PSV5_9EURY|nr:CheF family chemotaxis protein [Halonotius aquaticus]RJX42588.1 hypothetical protein DM826_09455 [Halonotius aquaticus]